MSTITIQCADISQSHCDVIVCPGYELVTKTGGLNQQIISKVDPLVLNTYRKLFEPVRNGQFISLPGSSLAKAILYTSEVPCLVKTEEMIRGLYRSILRYTTDHGHRSLALPLISVESYNFDLIRGWQIALEETWSFIKEQNYGLDIRFYTFELMTELQGKKIAQEMGIREIKKRSGLKATSKIRITLNKDSYEQIITLRNNGKVCYKSYKGPLIDQLLTMDIAQDKCQKLLKQAEMWADSHSGSETETSDTLELIDNDLNSEVYPLDQEVLPQITRLVNSFITNL